MPAPEREGSPQGWVQVPITEIQSWLNTVDGRLSGQTNGQMAGFQAESQ